MKGAISLRKRSETITIIVILVIVMSSFTSMFVLGANFLWCLLAPFITLLLFAPFTIWVRKAKHEINLLFYDVPILLFGFYLWDAIKIYLFGFGISKIGAGSSALTILMLIGAVSTAINLLASLIIWLMGYRPRIRYKQIPVYTLSNLLVDFSICIIFLIPILRYLFKNLTTLIRVWGVSLKIRLRYVFKKLIIKFSISVLVIKPKLRYIKNYYRGAKS
ncbi:MAG: hypothetical protein QG583_738 [Patescibacteria group bacterium]|nr:hypothetical protein [Patescibacteria group bacterium]